MKGEFEPTNIFDYSEEFFVLDKNNERLIETIKNQKCKLICINDSIQLLHFVYRFSIIVVVRMVLIDKFLQLLYLQ